MRDFQTIQNTAYDLIIIGGGINGAAVARDAALRGVKTIVVDKEDFGAGTTSWSTRLVHGGLRYLEYFEFHLVRESLKEREVLLKAAPHLVNPIQMTIPIYGSGSRSYWEIWAGMFLYDVLSFDKTLLNHRMLSAKKMRQLFRSVNPEDLKGAAQYYDGQAEYAERLCLENIMSAQTAGATTLNYVAVAEIQRQDDRITGLVCEDRLTGDRFTIKSSDKAVVINTSGPWVDQVLGLGQRGDRPAPIGKDKKMGGTKGSHIIVDSFPGAPDTALYVEAASDGRPYFIVPWLGMYLIGTTDLRYTGDLDKVKANDDEIDYLISETNRVVPTAHLSRKDIKFTYSGVRPLPNAEGKKPGSITRKHILFDHAKEGVSNLISLIGGKLTTHRQVGEEMVNMVYRKWQQPAPECLTDRQPLPGAIMPDDPKVDEMLETYGDRVAADSIHHLFIVYGAKAPEVLALVDDDASLGEKIVNYLPDIGAQAVYAIRSEMAYSLADICRRRTTLSMQANYGFDALPSILSALAKHCGWSEAECDRQTQAYRQFMEENCIPDYLIGSAELTRELQPAS